MSVQNAVLTGRGASETGQRSRDIDTRAGDRVTAPVQGKASIHAPQPSPGARGPRGSRTIPEGRTT